MRHRAAWGLLALNLLVLAAGLLWLCPGDAPLPPVPEAPGEIRLWSEREDPGARR